MQSSSSPLSSIVTSDLLKSNHSLFQDEEHTMKIDLKETIRTVEMHSKVEETNTNDDDKR